VAPSFSRAQSVPTPPLPPLGSAPFPACAGTFVRRFDLHVRVKAVWVDEVVDANLHGDEDRLAGILNAHNNLTPAEEAMFQQLLDSGAVFTPALQRRTSKDPMVAGSQCRPLAAAEDVVEFWLEARQTLGGDGPLAQRFGKLRALHSLVPQLRGDPHVGYLSQVELRQLWERVTGECGG
jgi:hypothetical protein